MYLEDQERVRRRIKRCTDDLLAISTGGSLALVFGDLHKSLLASASDFVWVARAFLHSDGGKHYGWDAMLCAIFIEGTNVFRTSFVRSLWRLNGFV